MTGSFDNEFRSLLDPSRTPGAVSDISVNFHTYFSATQNAYINEERTHHGCRD